jgi:alkylhydroperoxidase family enzyme
LRRHKVPEEKINGLLVAIVDRSLFSEVELTVLELADRMTEAGRAVSGELYDRLSSHFDHGEIVELVCSVGLFNYFNRVNDALQTEITR